jgi:hypothetical protein
MELLAIILIIYCFGDECCGFLVGPLAERCEEFIQKLDGFLAEGLYFMHVLVKECVDDTFAELGTSHAVADP